jgi:hypothetical protein
MYKCGVFSREVLWGYPLSGHCHKLPRFLSPCFGFGNTGLHCSGKVAAAQLSLSSSPYIEPNDEVRNENDTEEFSCWAILEIRVNT